MYGIIHQNEVVDSKLVLLHFRPLSDDEYYDKTPMRQEQLKQQAEQNWYPGQQYESFDVRWARDPHYVPPPVQERRVGPFVSLSKGALHRSR